MVAAVEAFRSSAEFWDIKMEFGLISYLQGIEDFKEKVRSHFSDLKLGSLELDGEEEIREVGDEGLRVEELFSPIHEDWATEDVASALPPAVIILSDHAEADESHAPEGA